MVGVSPVLTCVLWVHSFVKFCYLRPLIFICYFNTVSKPGYIRSGWGFYSAIENGRHGSIAMYNLNFWIIPRIFEPWRFFFLWLLQEWSRFSFHFPRQWYHFHVSVKRWQLAWQIIWIGSITLLRFWDKFKQEYCNVQMKIFDLHFDFCRCRRFIVIL